ncbi:type I polyketide synthase [Deminuibacter soli]|uniref:Acyltransferase domain-containing protein n=1 Tax=Deminuibacter soli TaxID=2291815 RepID=A0A3E1NH09_9BACT|nr:type I polyketide synthase [Deminuibacter soli]RFM27229.1 acyltransferase domain-containing protein [Deminuibacter soli]
MSHQTHIAIIGMSGMFPGAANVPSFWENILHKKDAIETVPANRIDALFFDTQTTAPDRFYCRRGGFIDAHAQFNPVPFGILPVAVEGTEPEQLLALQLARDALRDADLLHNHISLGNTGIIIGKGNYSGPAAVRAIEIVRNGEQLAALLRTALPHLSPEELQQVKQQYQLQKGRFTPDTVMGLIPNLTASLVANRLNLGGTAHTVDAACASSLLAVHQCIQELESGRCDTMIAGGVHACQNAPFWSIFTQLGALSRQQQIRPFDQKADGLLIGEGCGFVVLKKLEHALRDGNKVYAVIRGTGISSDGAGQSVMSPAVKGQVKAITQAWQQAGLPMQQVGYIEAHGTGTPLGDKTEIASLQQAFGFDAALPKAGLGSVKSNIGHAMPAAGIAGLIKTALALYYGKLPPTLHCDEPVNALQQTRFAPVTETADWDAGTLPRIAGVNAFGFGGINAHVVLQGFEASKQIPRKSTQSSNTTQQKDKVLLLARPSNEALLQALQHNEQQTGEGNFRIALFDPTPERIQKAIKIVTRNTPWRNRQDIWYTPEPLLSNGGKLAFVFPGLDGLAAGETASIAQYFNLTPVQHSATRTGELLHNVFAAINSSRYIDAALKQLGVQPDIIAGHSLGEWLGWSSAGMVEEASVLQLLGDLNPADYQLQHSRFLAVGCGYDRIKPLMDQIPGLYLSNDNCPQQIIVCGTPEAVEQLTTLLLEQQVFHQQLPFQSGFHSPFVKAQLPLLLANVNKISFTPGKVPLWSATSLQPYPQNKEAILALTEEHLTHTVRFRELTQQLYKEGVRVFIQAGAGGLNGFIDDTLKQQSYSAVAANVATRSGIGQLQRVLAALFVEGRAIAMDFIQPQQPVKQAGTAIQLQLGSPLVQHWPLLQSIATPPAKPRAAGIPVSQPVQALPAHAPALAQTVSENIALLQEAQNELLALLQQRPVTSTTPAFAAPPPVQPKQFNAPLQVSLHTHPYLLDHALMRQKEGWQHMDDMEPVIPMTMILELFADAAANAAPGKRVLQINEVQVFQWMSVATDLNSVIQCEWQNNNSLQLHIDQYARAGVLLGDSYTAAPPFNLNPGEATGIAPDRATIYRGHMFHGPAYQGIVRVLHTGKQGITGIIEGGTGKGSLLDNAGQLFGLWLQLTLTEERVAFPVNIREVNFYDDYTRQHGTFECTCVLTQLTPEYALGDFILMRDGKVWATIKGWQNRRLEIDARLWQSCMQPLGTALSDMLAPGVFFFNSRYQRVNSWHFILKRYFTGAERRYRQQLPINKQKQWTISRIAAKDAVRYVLDQRDASCYLNELSIHNHTNGQPYASGETTADIQLSIAHKGTDAVAIAAAGKRVGIDIELIAPRSEGFIDMVFAAQEWALIKDLDLPEWTTRCWVAKEAYAKYLGTGLQGNPKQYGITAIQGHALKINETWITTIQHKNYIIGWTI